LGILVTLIAEKAVDPLDHRHGRSRHAGDQDNVHASHEHLADPQVTERIDRYAVPYTRPFSNGTESRGDAVATALTPISRLSENWLATDEARCNTGQSLMVDGGTVI
jgi:hypothetical protein